MYPRSRLFTNDIDHREAAQYSMPYIIAIIILWVKINADIFPGAIDNIISRISSIPIPAIIGFLWPNIVIGTAEIAPPTAKPA